MTRPSSDRMAMYAGANILWHGDEIQFRVEKPGGTGGGEFEVRAWDRQTGKMRILANEQDLQTLWLLKGPRGGELATSGNGDRPELIETLPGGPRSEEHTSELQSLMRISYAVFCLQKKHTIKLTTTNQTNPTQQIP